MSSSKAALHMRVFVSAVQSHMHERPQKCAQHNQPLQITGPRSSLFPLIFHGLLLLLISCLTRCGWLFGEAWTLLRICAMQKTAEVSWPWSCVSVVFPIRTRRGWQWAVPLSGASVPSVLEPSGHGWWKSRTSLTLSLRLATTRQCGPASKVNGNAVFVCTAQPWVWGCPCEGCLGSRD